VFCDACGLRLSPPPACAKCHLPLAPDTNFCEACGTPVGTAPVAPGNISPKEAKTPDSPKKEKGSKGRKGKKRALKRDEFVLPAMLAPETAITTNTLVSQDPPIVTQDKAEPPPPPKAPEQTGHGLTKGLAPRIPKKVILATGFLILGLILVLAAGTGMVKPASLPFMQDISRPAVPEQQTVVPVTEDTVIPTQQPSIPQPSVVPGPTQVPPDSLLIWLQAERDPVSNIVTVLFEGGKGQRAVREIQVRLTRSDGQVLTQIFRPLTVGDGATLQGTRYVDRLEVVVAYNNGEEYTVIDKVFAYKMRN
jgi:hypothetical protein